MSDDRQLLIQYNNGAKLEVTFPVQIRNSTAALMDAMKRALESDKLVIQTEDRVLVIPWSSVQQIEIRPLPPALPFGAIKGARIVR